MQRVFVLGSDKQPLMPCHPARARKILKSRRASIFRRQPFTIILHDRDDGYKQQLDMRVDPGSKVTGLALVLQGERKNCAIWAGELNHRGHIIKCDLDKRRARRRVRRSRKCRYRKPRFKNRLKTEGWLPPSLQSRVDNIETWTQRLQRFAPISVAQVETTRFDTQLMDNPNISDIEYQRGTLYGEELRQYLLQKYNYTCAYCKGFSGDSILNREHVHPRSRGGSDRLGNQVISCKTCNQLKGSYTAGEWAETLSGSRSKPNKARASNAYKIQQEIKPSMRDAAAMNAIRYAVGNAIKRYLLDVTFWSGGRTSFNRKQQGYSKAHWIDALCVGNRGDNVYVESGLTPLIIKSAGHGSRQMCSVDRHGFPRASAKTRNVKGFYTGDLVEACVPRGKYSGRHMGRATVRKNGCFTIQSTACRIVYASYKNCRKLHSADGFIYY